MFKSIISLLLFITICSKSFSQNDSITINQDPKLLKVMELKKLLIKKLSLQVNLQFKFLAEIIQIIRF